MTSESTISRITVADVPLAPMSPAELERLGDLQAFSNLDPNFRKSKAFQTIIANDTRLVSFSDGDIVIREGDWGNSAFLIESGTVMVDVGPAGSRVPDEFLGRPHTKRKGFFQALALIWSTNTAQEYRDTKTYQDATGVGRRGTGEHTRIFLRDFPAVMNKYRTLELTTGQLFGELGALGRSARSSTVIAQGEVRLLEMRWQGLRDLMRHDQGFREMIDKTFRENALLDFLRKSPIFEHLKENESAMAELLTAAQLNTYGDYDKVGTYKQLVSQAREIGLEHEPLVATEGDYPNGVVLIRNGLARVSKRHHHGHLTVNYLGAGQVYGLNEIERGFGSETPIPLEHSLRAIGFLTTIEIPTLVIEKHLLQPSTKGKASSGHDGDSKTRLSTTDTTDLPQDFVEFLVQKRFVNGTETMLIDLNRCTRCDDCVRACAHAHDNNPRFVRQGPINNNIMVANACMHCQDPVCMIECPTGAITRRQQDGVIVINDVTCIGCATCANNCPYDAIRMVEIRGADGTIIRDLNSGVPIPKATKCDLCIDQLGGPACQRACPHDALVRMDMRNVQKLRAWQDR